jgi:hypothetical protein
MTQSRARNDTGPRFEIAGSRMMVARSVGARDRD